ncbi:MAG: bifunctional adenosylcobinamide kinase/adenosylcobinamide-phosphate guanylyltransferase [Bacillota bacterium]|nr:bifunctional adenosylcobinamide kinase/adenosylcobinamide-phosphate guanylyltransferase [Bacillota bacterium]
MNIFISGGCKNGKSYYAQRRAKEMAESLGVPLYYIATMIPHDDEDRARIKRHISEREGWGFETIEQGLALTEILHNDDVDKNGVFLMDSVTALLDNEMFDEKGNIDEAAPERVKRDVLDFAAGTGNTVFVSDYIYGDAGYYSETVEGYRRGLAAADRALTEVCEEVIEIAYGTEERWK